MIKKLGKKTKTYLEMLGATDDSSLPLTRGFAKAAGVLKDAGLAIYIPKSQGGADVCLTREGVEMYFALFGDKNE